MQNDLKFWVIFIGIENQTLLYIWSMSGSNKNGPQLTE
jgi:hypothetical protein